jgi:hypothetical protein
MTDLREAVQVEFDLIERTLAALPAPEELQKLTLLETSGTAALLQNIYSGLENIIKRVALARGLKIPGGSSWHKDLLRLAGDNHILSESTVALLVTLLGFRHISLHGYGVTLEAARMEPLVRALPKTVAAFQEDIRRLL